MNIKKTIPEVDDVLIQNFSRHSAATVHEAMGRRGAMDAAIKPIAKGMKLCGRAVTVRCHPSDNLMLIKAISMGKKGDVIVCDLGTNVNCGPFGEVLAVECISKGLAGLVTTSSVRDSVDIVKRGFPVFSSGLSVRGTAKATLGTINESISCGDVIVRPGDIILGDDDGVVVIPLEEAEAVLYEADKRVEKEALVMERLEQGESLFDIYGYQKVFDSLGCTEE